MTLAPPGGARQRRPSASPQPADQLSARERLRVSIAGLELIACEHEARLRAVRAEQRMLRSRLATTAPG